MWYDEILFVCLELLSEKVKMEDIARHNQISGKDGGCCVMRYCLFVWCYNKNTV
jgi:hypothetical protein